MVLSVIKELCRVGIPRVFAEEAEGTGLLSNPIVL